MNAIADKSGHRPSQPTDGLTCLQAERVLNGHASGVLTLEAETSEEVVVEEVEVVAEEAVAATAEGCRASRL